MPHSHLIQAFVLAALALLVPLSRAAAATSAKPNFVIILTDDQGYADLGSYGATQIRTPALDRMAAEGMRFTACYAQPFCGPSRAALMTGSYPIRIGEPGNRKTWHSVPHPKEQTLAEILQAHGYATGIVGKWHLTTRDPQDPTGFTATTMPNAQGFDYFYGTPLFNGSTVNVTDVAYRSPILRNREIVTHAVENWDSATHDFTREALAFIREHRDRPFFLYLAHVMPHIPLGASAAFKGRSAGGPYGDTIEEIDWSAGEILRTLTELGLDERTVVVFMSDNGPWIEPTRGNKPGAAPFIPRDHYGSAGPLRGYKFLTWEGGVRVPCIVRWPGRIPAGAVSAEPVTNMDFLPTFAAWSGARLPSVRLDGRDIGPLLEGRPGVKSPHKVIYYYSYTHLQAVRVGRWKLVVPRPEQSPWLLFGSKQNGDNVAGYELYDVEADIGERTDVAGKHPDVVRELKTLIAQARNELGDYDHVGIEARFFDEGPHRPDRDDWKIAAKALPKR